MSFKHLRDIEAVRELVRAKARLEDVIEDKYGIKVYGRLDTRKIVCPFHADTDPSLGISVPKQVYYCHGCEAKGDVFTFVQQMDQLTHIAAIRALADWGGVSLSEYEEDASPEDVEQFRLLQQVEEIAVWSQRGADAKPFQRWADARRFDPAILEEYRVGFAVRVPPIKGAERLEVDSEKPARWKGRVVVPIRDDVGRPVAFRTRAMGDKGIKVMGPSEGYPLSVPPVYGFFEAKRYIREAGHLILVEGEGDVWQMASHGYRNVCATFGTHFGQEAAAYLHERGVRRVTFLPDADEAGARFASRTSLFRYPGLSIQIATLAKGDPDEALLTAPGLVADALSAATHALEFAIEDKFKGRALDTITDRMDALHDMQEVIQAIPEYEREMAVRVLADRLDMSADGLSDYFREASTPDRLHNVQAERVVLSAALMDPEFMGEVVLGVLEADFYLLKHRQIYGAMARLYRTEDDVTRETLALYLKNRGHETAARYVEGLDEPTDGAPYLLKDIKDKSIRRQTRERAQNLLSRISDTGLEARDVLSSFSADLSRVVVGTGERMKDIADLVHRNVEVVHQRIANPNLIIGLDLGPDWRLLNRTIHGLQDGRYVIIAAPTGAGKSAVACSWARRLSVELGEPGLFITHEMSEEALTNRLVAGDAGLELDKIVTGHLTEEEVELFHDASHRVAASPLTITTRGRTFEEAISLIRHDIIRRGTRYVVIDYLQLMGLADARGKGRHQELGDISKGLLDLSQETGIITIALAQINREGTKRGGQSTSADVGESFKISQDSDLFYVLTTKTDDEQEAEGVGAGNRYGFLDKHRHGRDKVGCDIEADMATMTIREVHRNG